jgi:hypothetical protein
MIRDEAMDGMFMRREHYHYPIISHDYIVLYCWYSEGIARIVPTEWVSPSTAYANLYLIFSLLRLIS